MFFHKKPSIVVEDSAQFKAKFYLNHLRLFLMFFRR